MQLFGVVLHKVVQLLLVFREADTLLHRLVLPPQMYLEKFESASSDLGPVIHGPVRQAVSLPQLHQNWLS